MKKRNLFIYQIGTLDKSGPIAEDANAAEELKMKEEEERMKREEEARLAEERKRQEEAESCA